MVEEICWSDDFSCDYSVELSSLTHSGRNFLVDNPSHCDKVCSIEAGADCILWSSFSSCFFVFFFTQEKFFFLVSVTDICVVDCINFLWSKHVFFSNAQPTLLKLVCTFSIDSMWRLKVVFTVSGTIAWSFEPKNWVKTETLVITFESYLCLQYFVVYGYKSLIKGYKTPFR